jgi:hypothetical protein
MQSGGILNCPRLSSPATQATWPSAWQPFPSVNPGKVNFTARYQSGMVYEYGLYLNFDGQQVTIDPEIVNH